MAAHVVPANAEAPVPAGLGGGADTGGVLSVAVQPGTPIFHNFRLRISNLEPVQQSRDRLPDPLPRPRRVATMLDFYPVAETKVRLSAGMRLLSKRGRQIVSPSKALLIYAPPIASRLPVRTNMAAVAPAATLGWTTGIAGIAVFGIEAGTIMNHGGVRTTAATIAQPQLKGNAWSRIDPVAQVAFALKF